MKALVLCLFMCLLTPAFAGTNYSGSGPTQEAACKAAEEKAAPKSQGVCYTPCRGCKQNGATWTCVSNVPDWSSSCNNQDKYWSPPPPPAVYNYQTTLCGGRVGVLSGSTATQVSLNAMQGPVMIRWVFQKDGKVSSTLDVQMMPGHVESATAQPNGTIGFDCI